MARGKKSTQSTVTKTEKKCNSGDSMDIPLKICKTCSGIHLSDGKDQCCLPPEGETDGDAQPVRKFRFKTTRSVPADKAIATSSTAGATGSSADTDSMTATQTFETSETNSNTKTKTQSNTRPIIAHSSSTDINKVHVSY